MEKYWACSCPEYSAGQPRSNTIHVWSLDTYAVEFMLHGHTMAVYALCFNSDQSRLASASLDKTARIWDFRNQTQLAELQHDAELGQVLFLDEDSRLLTCSFSDVFVWDIETTSMVLTLKINSSYSYCCCYLGSDDILFSRDNQLWTVNLETKAKRMCSERSQDLIWEITVSSSHDMFATSVGRTVTIWLRENFSIISEFLNSGNSDVSSLRFNPAGDLLVTGCTGAGGPITVWNWATQTVVCCIPDVLSCRCINFTSDSTKIVCALSSRFIVVDIELGKIVGRTNEFNIEGCNLQYVTQPVILM